MAIPTQYQADVEAILARRHDNGADYWATPDGKLNVGSPFTTLECAYILPELGMEPSHPVLRETADLIFAARREDGRFKLFPKGAIYPCHTINAARTLCYLGHASDPRLQKTFEHLLAIRHSDGGWRCNKIQLRPRPGNGILQPRPHPGRPGRLPLHGLCDNSPAWIPQRNPPRPLDHSQAPRPLPLRHRHAVHAGNISLSPTTTCSSMSTCCPSTARRRRTPASLGAGRAGIQADQRPDRRGTPQPKAGRVRLLQKKDNQRTRHPPLPRAIANLR